MTKRCGYIALIGAPNAGKSELVNKLTGQKISIVSPKVQTTRTRVLGIVTENNAQCIFIDTPGIFKPARRLDRAMVASAHNARDDADIIALIVDASRKDCLDTVDRLCARTIPRGDQKRILILNKIDLLKRDNLLPLTAAIAAKHTFDAVFMISALKNNGVADLLSWAQSNIPEGEYTYDEDLASDTPDRILAAEIVREKIYLRLHDELPYGIAVTCDDFEEREDGEYAIRCTIHTSQARHKGMIIGAGGQTLKIIGTLAREELTHLFETPTHLFLEVTVTQKWDEKHETLNEFGFDS